MVTGHLKAQLAAMTAMLPTFSNQVLRRYRNNAEKLKGQPLLFIKGGPLSVFKILNAILCQHTNTEKDESAITLHQFSDNNLHQFLQGLLFLSLLLYWGIWIKSITADVDIELLFALIWFSYRLARNTLIHRISNLSHSQAGDCLLHIQINVGLVIHFQCVNIDIILNNVKISNTLIKLPTEI